MVADLVDLFEFCDDVELRDVVRSILAFVGWR